MINKLKKYVQSVDLIVWFILLRWIAVIVALVLIILSTKVFHYLEEASFLPLIFLIFIIVLTNITFTIFVKKNLYLKHLKEIQIISDLILLTLMLHYSGGIENTLSFIYIFHVILSGILLSKKKCYSVVLISIFLYSIIAIGQLSGTLSHYTLYIYPHPSIEKETVILDESTTHNHRNLEDHNLIHAAHNPIYVWNIILLNFFLMLLTAYFITNIMDRLRKEELNSLEKHQWLKHVLHSTEAGLLVFNKKMKVVWFNKPIEEWLSLGSEEIIEQGNIIKDWLKENLPSVKETFTDGKIQSLEKERTDLKNGNIFFHLTVAPLRNNKEEIYQVVVLVQDISEKKVSEEHLIKVQKLVAIGETSSLLAHEIRNSLTSVKMLLQLQKESSHKEVDINSFNFSLNSIERIEKVIKNLLSISYKSQYKLTFSNFNNIVNDSLVFIEPQIEKNNVKLFKDLNNNLPNFFFDVEQIKESIINILLNSIQALGNRGEIKIRSKVITLSQNITSDNLSDHVLNVKDKTQYVINLNKGMNVVCLEVEDNGCGITEININKIFDPFFTTKENGSGLGLSMVKKVINSHDGILKIKSKINEGTLIRIYLPIKDSI